MREMRLTNVVIQNFRSFKDAEVTFSSNTGLKYLGGENRTEPRLGANGAGKSSLWEAIVWCLYGKSIRGARTSQVVAWGAEQVMVSVSMASDNYAFHITRYGPPERIEIDRPNTLAPEPVTQEEVDSLLGLTRERFLHSVIFGQGQRLFPDLTIPERSSLLDEVLDLAVWNKASELATTKSGTIAEEMRGLERERDTAVGALGALATDEYIDRLTQGWEEEHSSRALQLKHGEDQWIVDRERCRKRLYEESAAWASTQAERVQQLGRRRREADEAALRASSPFAMRHSEDELQAATLAVKGAEGALNAPRGQINHFNYQIQERQKEQHVLEASRECPTCKRPLSVENYETRKVILADDIAQAAQCRDAIVLTDSEMLVQQTRTLLDVLKGELAEDRVHAQNAAQAHRTLLQQASDLRAQETWAQGEANPHSASLTMLEAETNPYTAQRYLVEHEINPHLSLRQQRDHQQATLKIELAELNECLGVLDASLTAVGYWKTGFKRIRLFFVQQILAALEVEIQSAISALGLLGWQVMLATETETKSGTTKLGVQVRIRSAEGNEGLWETWSGGESQRLRHAMAMGLASLIQRAAGVWYNFEVWDEPSAWLSEMGIEDLLLMLDHRATSQNKHVWLVDQRTLAYSGFRESWSAIKTEQGTQLELIGETV